MASITYTKTAVCAGGGHVTLARSGGTVGGSVVVQLADILGNPPSVDELIACELVLLRWIAAGKTLGQLNTAFTNGVTISTS